MTFFAIPTGSSTPALESHSASAALRCSSGTAAASIVDRDSLLARSGLALWCADLAGLHGAGACRGALSRLAARLGSLLQVEFVGWLANFLGLSHQGG